MSHGSTAAPARADAHAHDGDVAARSSRGAAAETLALTFDVAANECVHEQLSSVVQIGDDLWLGSDEGTTIERLSPVPGGYGKHRSFAIRDYIDLPGDADDEIDVEGLEWSDGYLWIAGSHSARRRKPKSDDDVDRGMARLARVERAGNRYLLGRIPMVRSDDGSYEPARRAPAADGESSPRLAARLPGGRRRNHVVHALRRDAHLAPFLSIPGKDNGFDIEGFAVDGDRVLLGLRGPVLRGWATILVVAPRPRRKRPDRLRLRRIGADGRRYQKHLLDLHGLGVRELCIDGRDLLILAGPTMSLDGRATVFRWRGGLDVDGDSLVERDQLEPVLELPYGVGELEDVDHPEGLAIIERDGRRSLLVVYDAPCERRCVGDGQVLADVYPLR